MSFRSLILAAAAAIAVPAGATQLIMNGGFENTGFGGTSGYYNVGPAGSGADHAVPADFGFTVPVNNVDIVTDGAYGPHLAGGGKYELDLVGYGSTGAIAQSISTRAGKTYTVNIDYSENNGVTGATAAVTFGGAAVGTLDATHSWQHFTTTFVGTGAPASFAITEGVGGGNAGVFLNNISVTGSVPEPASWAMMVAGFALVGFATRRRGDALTA